MRKLAIFFIVGVELGCVKMVHKVQPGPVKPSKKENAGYFIDVGDCCGNYRPQMEHDSFYLNTYK